MVSNADVLSNVIDCHASDSDCSGAPLSNFQTEQEHVVLWSKLMLGCALELHLRENISLKCTMHIIVQKSRTIEPHGIKE